MVQSVIEIPQEPFLVKLFEHWQHSPSATIIRDRRDDDNDFTIERFLFDIWAVQKELYGSLDDEIKSRLNDPDDEVFVAIVVPGGYRYCVLLLAVYYLGATAMPLSPNILPEEAKYFLDLSNAVILLSVPSTVSLGATISKAYNITQFTFDTVPESAVPPKFTLSAAQTPINPDRSFLVIFTSGTTGRPKGVVHSRHSIITNLHAHSESIELDRQDLWLHYESMHRVGGFFLLFGAVLAGSCVEICEILSSTDDRLQRLQRGDAAATFLAPSLLYHLKDTLDEMRKTGDPVRYEAAIAGIRRLRVIFTGSDQVSPYIREAWAEIRGGKSLFSMYTSTEIMGPVASTGFAVADTDVPLNSVGRVQPQVKVKIAESGEICVKKPGLFKRYIGETPGETKTVFDAEGYYKMGDTGRLENGILYVLGRASQDLIRAGTWKIYTPGIEADISTHPLVSEAIALGVPDPICGEQVAVLLVLYSSHGLCQDRKSIPELSLPNLRRWLTSEKKMPPFRQPSMLRIVTSRDEVPTTETMKPIKAKIREIYFSQEQLANGEVERCEPLFAEPGAPANPFDYEGRQL